MSSSNPSPGVKIITTHALPTDKFIGPLSAIGNAMDIMVMIGLRCLEKQHSSHLIKVDPQQCEASDNKNFHWLFYVQSARDDAEQNLEVVAKNNQLYYRTIRNIESCEQLLVWYSIELANILQVPDVKHFYKDDRGYICPYCHEVFSYPNPLKAHLLYRCEKRLAEIHGLSSENRQQMASRNNDLRTFTEAKQHLKHPNMISMANTIFGGSSDTIPMMADGRTSCQNLPMENTSYLAANNASVPCSDIFRSILKHSIDPNLHDAEIKSQLYMKPNSDENRQLHGSLKPKFEPAGNSQSVIVQNRGSHLGMNPENRENVFVGLEGPESGCSAFKKVGKLSQQRINKAASESLKCASSIVEPQCCSAGKMACTVSFLNSLPVQNPSEQMPLMTSVEQPASSQTLCWSSPIIPNCFSVTDTSVYLTAFQTPTSKKSRTSNVAPTCSNLKYFEKLKTCPPFSMADKVSCGPVESSMNTAPTARSLNKMRPLCDQIYSFSFSKQIASHVNNVSAKSTAQPLMPPITASFLPPSLTALAFPAQNWCAKCNASFRMTSDLVYHMRSHHKRDTDPMKKQREEKLKCSICNENFRERHHLTRHMTSHQ